VALANTAKPGRIAVEDGAAVPDVGTFVLPL
jgi:hypothetical protein